MLIRQFVRGQQERVHHSRPLSRNGRKGPWDGFEDNWDVSTSTALGVVK